MATHEIWGCTPARKTRRNVYIIDNADRPEMVTVWIPVTPGARPTNWSLGTGAVVSKADLLKALGVE